MIRNAKPEDSTKIQELLNQLGYTHPTSFIENKLNQLLKSSNDIVLVYEKNKTVVAFLTIHYSIQLAFEGDFATIGYFVVDNSIRSCGIGREMEEYCTRLANERGCSLIELYSNANRVDAHRFYERQGYKAYEKYFMKELQ